MCERHIHKTTKDAARRRHCSTGNGPTRLGRRRHSECGQDRCAAVDIDAWANAINQMRADSPAEDEQTMRRAIEKHRQQAKAQTRREPGWSAALWKDAAIGGGARGWWVTPVRDRGGRCLRV